MWRRWTQKKALPALTAGLAVSLLLLAGLQYRWIGEMSEADRDRLRRGLGAAAQQYRADFNRELASVAAAFRMPPEVVANRAWDTVADDYSLWVNSGPLGLAVEAVYIREAARDAEPRVLRLDVEESRFVQVDAAPEINVLLDSSRGFLGRGPGGPRSAFWAYLPRGPALISPLAARSPGGRGRGRPVGRLLIVLDRTAIIEYLLPEIGGRLLPEAEEDHPYQLAVIDPAGPQILYTNSTRSAEEFLGEARQTPLVFSGEELLARIATRRDRAAPPDPEQFPERARFGPRAVVASLPGSPGWILAAQFSGGSLDEVVEGLRTRNLAISFGILILLSAGMVLALVSARRAERLAQLQMEFVAGVSHELRTPVAVMRQAADNLAEGVVTSADQAREYGRLIRTEGRRLSRMVEQTLQFASSRAGKQRYSVETLPAGPLLEQAVEEVQTEIDEAGITIDMDIPDDFPAVRGDRTAVLQCLRNLLSNAVKYGDGAIRLSASREGRFAAIQVADSGLGIPAEDLPHIFEPFYRGKHVVDEQIQGSGLGLSLAKEAAEASGGSLQAASRHGRGSTFTLRLPLAEIDEASE